MPDTVLTPVEEQNQSVPTPTPPVSRKTEKPPRNYTGLLVLILLFTMVGAGMEGYSFWTDWQIRHPAVSEEPPVEVVKNPETAEEIAYLEFNDRQIPILQDLPVNEYDVEAFHQEDGIIRYKEAQLGIDVSQHQGDVDWQAVADFGVEFAFIRLGCRGYGQEGNIILDEKFHQNMVGAKEAGLDVGVYFFSQATSVWETEEEALFVLKNLEKYELDLPVVFDWEHIDHSSSARTNGVLGQSITLYAQVFCEEMKSAGYDPMVYFNQNLGYLHLNLEALSDYPFWLASYRSAPNFHYHFDYWQYSHTGTVDGVEGAVDLNLKFS